MHSTLNGKKIAILATNGVDQVELAWPWEAILDAGGDVDLIALDRDDIQGAAYQGVGYTFPVDKRLSETRAGEYDALILPGGGANLDTLGRAPGALAFVRQFPRMRRPIAAICDAPLTLVRAGLVDGRKLTSCPELKPLIHNAGGKWLDSGIVIDRGLITTRQSDELDEFCDAIIGMLRPTTQRHVNAA